MSKAIIYVLSEYSDHEASAGYIANRLKTKTKKYDFGADEGAVPIVKKGSELRAYLSDPKGKDVVKIYIIAHGNQDVVVGRRGAMEPMVLAHHMWDCGLKDLCNRLGTSFPIRLTLLSCMSGSADPRDKDALRFGVQLASSLSRYLKGSQSLVVKCCDGASYTTDEGRNHVFLTDGSDSNLQKTLDRSLKYAQGKYAKLDPKIRHGTAEPKTHRPIYKAYAQS